MASASGRSPIISSTTARLCASFSLQEQAGGCVCVVGVGGVVVGGGFSACHRPADWVRLIIEQQQASFVERLQCSYAVHPSVAQQHAQMPGSCRQACAWQGRAAAPRGLQAVARGGVGGGRTGWPAQSPLGPGSPHPAPSHPQAAHRRQTGQRRGSSGDARAIRGAAKTCSAPCLYATCTASDACACAVRAGSLPAGMLCLRVCTPARLAPLP